MSFAVYKKDYDEVVPAGLRPYSGNFHYSYAIRQFIQYIPNLQLNLIQNHWNTFLIG